MKIGLISEKSKHKDLEHNIKMIKNNAQTFSGHYDMIFFGEAFLHGFNALSWTYLQDKRLALSKNSNEINQIKTMAKRYGIAIGFGYFEHDEQEEAIYCSYMIIDRLGQELDHYRRVSIGWKEYTKTDAHYKEGQGFHSFSYMNKSFVTALCGDAWYDQHVDEINKIDKDIVLWPLHIDYTVEEWMNDKGAYELQTKKISSPMWMINNISESSYGGCYVFNKGSIKTSLPLGQRGALTVTI